MESILNLNPFNFRMPRFVLSAKACLAAWLCVAILLVTGCTPAQKQTTLQIVTEINVRTPEVVAAADTVAAVVSGFLPTDAVLIGIASVAFDASAKTLQALCASYIANPNASVLAQIQAAVTTLESQINQSTLTAVGIKSSATQQAVLAALKGLLTVVTVVFALITPTLSTAQLEQLKDSNTIHLAKVRPYMDENVLEASTGMKGIHARMAVNQAFESAEASGL